MPIGHLNESSVQDAAIQWLTQHYRLRFGSEFVWARKEVRIAPSPKVRNGRADGLIVVRLPDKTIFTASLEAKSWRTWHHIKVGSRDITWVLHAAIICGIVLILTGYWGVNSGNIIGTLIFPILISVIVTSIFLVATQNHSFYHSVGVIDQVKRYPANEQWIALSSDAYNRLGEQTFNFKRNCERHGVGLIQVNGSKKVVVQVKPKFQKPPKKIDSFINCYAKSEVIRMELDTLTMKKSVDLDAISVVPEDS